MSYRSSLTQKAHLPGVMVTRLFFPIERRLVLAMHLFGPRTDVTLKLPSSSTFSPDGPNSTVPDADPHALPKALVDLQRKPAALAIGGDDASASS